MKRHPLRNSGATLLDGTMLEVESPERERYPVDTFVLTLTSRCNLDCVMCLEPRGTGAPDLPFEQAMGLVETFAGRVPRVWSCAGEALLHPRFFELATAISRRGSSLGIGTNGLVLSDRRFLARCAAAGVRVLHVSCHTCRPERFAALTGTRGRRRFDQLVRALRNVDAWNGAHEPARQLAVLLQLVLMRPFEDELEAYLDFVAAHLAHTPLTIRVEPMQPMNAGKDHPELQLDLVEVGRIVRRLIDEHGRRFTFEFKSIPLCLLEGAEGQSEDLCTRARGTVVVGNVGRQSAGLQLQCPIGDPAASAFAATCARCTLVHLCPGVMDNPVPAGAPWPRPRAGSAVELLARLGLRTDFAAHRFDLVYPRLADVPHPDGVLARLSDEQLGLDPAAARSFAPAQRARLDALVDALRRDDALVEARVTDRYGALCLHVADGAAGQGIVILEPAQDGTPCYVEAGGVAVRYNGQMTPGLAARLERVAEVLALTPRPAAAGAGTRSGPRTGRGRRAGPRGTATRGRRSARSSRRGR